jgi:UDP-N-acetylglucosamine 2-epimerase
LYGTRPEAIKMAPVIAGLRQQGFDVCVVNSGQHDHLMPTIMDLFDITVDETLNVLSPGQTLGTLTERLLQAVSERLAAARPEFLIVQGDTTTAFAGALAAFYRRIPVAHVEAGLRTFVLDSPFPEEALRRMISAIATWNFCPSEQAATVLRHERVPGQIVVTGNPVVDALHTIREAVVPLAPPSRRRVVATIHRRENFPYLEAIFTGLAQVAELPGVEVVLPVHANPVIQAGVERWLTGSRVKIVAPFDYLPWIQFLESASLVITDSGGLQEEAPVLGIPLLVARESTERSEVIDQGYGYLVGTSTQSLVDHATRALAGTLPFKQGSPYGDGTASQHISAILSRAVHG